MVLAGDLGRVRQQAQMDEPASVRWLRLRHGELTHKDGLQDEDLLLLLTRRVEIAIALPGWWHRHGHSGGSSSGASARVPRRQRGAAARAPSSHVG